MVCFPAACHNLSLPRSTYSCYTAIWSSLSARSCFFLLCSTAFADRWWVQCQAATNLTADRWAEVSSHWVKTCVILLHLFWRLDLLWRRKLWIQGTINVPIYWNSSSIDCLQNQHKQGCYSKTHKVAEHIKWFLNQDPESGEGDQKKASIPLI